MSPLPRAGSRRSRARGRLVSRESLAKSHLLCEGRDSPENNPRGEAGQAVIPGGQLEAVGTTAAGRAATLVQGPFYPRFTEAEGGIGGFEIPP